MGRKEFNERLDELNHIRKKFSNNNSSRMRSNEDQKYLEMIEKEIDHLKLIPQI